MSAPLPPAEPTFTPALPAVVARPEGVLTRLFDRIQEIKETNACTDAMCLDFGITGPEEATPGFNTIRPDLTAARSGNQVLNRWGFQGMGKHLDGVDIHVDRGSCSNHMVTDTNPNYIDTFPHPATPTIWKYKAIYRIGDSQVGQWSPEVSVVVGG